MTRLLSLIFPRRPLVVREGTKTIASAWQIAQWRKERNRF